MSQHQEQVVLILIKPGKGLDKHALHVFITEMSERVNVHFFPAVIMPINIILALFLLNKAVDLVIIVNLSA